MKPLKIVIEDDIKIIGDGDIVEIEKRLSPMEVEKLFIDLFGTTNVGTLDYSEIVDEALKKQVPMKHHHTIVNECSGGERVRISICPNCLGCIMTVEEEFPRFCVWCGQAIKWE
jgi:hypothetical protein